MSSPATSVPPTGDALSRFLAPANWSIGDDELGATRELQEEIRALARQKSAVILAHNYQLPAVQEVADIVGDSLYLSMQARDLETERIVFCGVHF
ncbi:MAG TPA: quinolinate synthase NadA, partial [Planctomycetota bacterium]|nr:quinolinate synthase NadA [Planctomycetota bacterium]